MNGFCFGKVWGRLERDGARLTAIASCSRCGAYVELPLNEPRSNVRGEPGHVYPEVERAIERAVILRLPGEKIHR